MTNILPTYPRSNLEFTHGKGCYLYGLDGNEYLDFGSGIAVNSLGYSHEYLNNQLLEQSKKWNKNKIQKALKKTYNTEIEMKSNSSIRKDLLIKNLIIDLCVTANSA